MGLAFAEAELAFREDEVPVGAVIVREGELLGKGHNQTKRLADPTAHAEMIAITAACNALGSERLDECDLYCTLEPCPMCATGLVLGRLRRVYYAARDERMGGCGSFVDLASDPRLPHRLEAYQFGDEGRSLGMLSGFFASRRRKDVTID